MGLRTFALIGAVLCNAEAAGQTVPTPLPVDADASAAGTTGVLLFQPDFFAGSRPNTALDMILRLPGFALDVGDPSTRGLSGSAGNVLIDGKRPSSKSDTLDEVLRRIAAASVERIELIRGGAPGIDMQGRPVIANVIVKRAATTEIVAEANSYVYDNGFFGPSAKLQYSRREGDDQTEGSIFATRDRTGGTARGRRRRFDPAGSLIEQAELALDDRIVDVNARGSIQRRVGGGRLRINALAGFTAADASQAIDVLSGTDSGNASRQHMPTGELGANWTRALGPRTDLELTALQRLTGVRYSADAAGGGDSSTFTIRSTEGESNARAVLKFRRNDRWAFEGGGEVAYNFLDSRTGYVENGSAIPLPNASVLISELRGEGFAQATWHPGAKLTVAGTLRVEVSRIAQDGDVDLRRSFIYPKPLLQITWLPSSGNQFRFRFEKKVGQLNFEDFSASTEVNLDTVLGGNADLKPQRSTVFEAVYERRFWGRGALELTAGHRELRDIVDFVPLVDGFDAVGNIGDGHAEFVRSQLTLPFDRLGVKNALLTVRASWTASRVTDPLTGKRRRLSNEIPFDCGISFSHDLKGGRFSYGAEHGCNVDRFSAYRIGEARFYEGQPFVTVYGVWKPRRDLTVRIDLGNITNARSTVLRDIYQGPRNAAPLAFSEERALRQGRYAYLQVRRTF